jgi:phosphatidylglycerophosphate synthase
MGHSDALRRRRAALISVVIIVRVACAVLLFYVFANGHREWALPIFLCAIVCDALDGWLARRFNVVPSLGAYADAGADLLLVLAAFGAFVIKGVYPEWTLPLIVGMFVQFIWTSGREQPLYDPLGKYYGVFLFAAVGATLAFPRPAISRVVLAGIPVFTAVSLASRVVFFRRRRKRTEPDS